MSFKVMYVSRRFETNICATIHLKALQELFGDDLFVVDLRTELVYSETENRLNLGKLSVAEKIKQRLEINTWYLTNKRIDKICDIVQREKIEKIFIDESAFGKLVKKVKKRFPNVKVITFYHDIGKMLYPQWLREQGIHYLPDFIGSMYGERINQKNADCNLVLNHRDFETFERPYGKKPDGLLPAAVADPDFSMVSAREFNFEMRIPDQRLILFVGAKYFPNLIGLKWFVENVFVKLSNRYRLIVIGRGLEDIQEEYKEYDRIEIVGGVEFLAPYYNNADIVIAPLFDGGGMKQKTAEALAYGKPFVGTKESLYGYEEAEKILYHNVPIVYSCDDPVSQLSAFKTIEKNNIYGRFDELTNLFEEKYSLGAIKREFRKWLF